MLSPQERYAWVADGSGLVEVYLRSAGSASPPCACCGEPFLGTDELGTGELAAPVV
jgi:hypothetical protein